MGSKRIFLAVCAVIVTIVAFLLGYVSLSLPNWWTVTDGNGNTGNLGLFRCCVTINGIEDCDYNTVCCLVCMCIFAYMTHHNKTRGRYGTALILGIVCLILAVFAGIMFGFAKPRKSDREGIVVVASM